MQESKYPIVIIWGGGGGGEGKQNRSKEMVSVNSFGVVNSGGVASFSVSESMHMLMLTVSAVVPQPTPKKVSCELGCAALGPALCGHLSSNKILGPWLVRHECNLISHGECICLFLPIHNLSSLITA